MKWPTLRRWLLGGALGTSWLLGSTQVMSQVEVALQPLPLVVAGPAPVPQPVGSQVSLSFELAPAVAGEVLASGQQVQSDPSGTVAVLPLSASAPSGESGGGMVLPPLTVAPASGSGARVLFPRAEPEPQRRSYVDLTAAPCFARAPDYNWIIGRVEYLASTREWRLRYASVDEVDRYGGRVTLVESQHVKYLVDGLYIHVRGHLVNPDGAEQGPVYYRVEWFRTVEDPNKVQSPGLTSASAPNSTPSTLPGAATNSMPLLPPVAPTSPTPLTLPGTADF